MANLPLTAYLDCSTTSDFRSVECLDLTDKHVGDLDAANEAGETPLVVAARKRNYEAVTIILKVARQKEVALDFNRKDRFQVSLLQRIIESGDIELIKAFLKQGEGKINLSTSFEKCETIYEWILFQADLSEDIMISTAGIMIDFGFVVPSVFPTNDTLVECIIWRVYDMLEESFGLSDEKFIVALDKFFPKLVIALESLRRLAENEGDPKRRLFTEVSQGQNVLHLCCITGQSNLLEYFLRSLEEIDRELLASMLNENDNYVPAFDCINTHRHYPNMNYRCWKHCLELLVHYGQDINCVAPDFKMTLLHCCLIMEPERASQVEMSTYLIEQGACVTNRAGFQFCPIVLAVAEMREEFVDTAIKVKAFKPNEVLAPGSYNSNLLGVLTACVSEDSRVIGTTSEKLEKCLRLMHKLLDYGCTLETRSIINIMRTFSSSQIGRALFPTLLELGVSLAQGIDSLDVVTTSVVADGLEFFKILVQHGASVNLENRMITCSKRPPHRRVTHLNIDEKTKFFGYEFDVFNDQLECHLCCNESETGHQITTCTAKTCNMYICAGCMFFTGAEEGFTALDMARRKSNTKFINILHFLQNTPIGQRISSEKMVGLADMLLNAKIYEESMLQNLSMDDLINLGVVDDFGMKTLCQHLVF